MITGHSFVRLMLALLLALPLLAGGSPFFLTGAAAHDSTAEMGRDPRTRIFGRGAVPLCDDPRVLRQVQSKFAWADRNTWSEISNRKTTISINAIGNIKQRYSLNQTKSLITHRHCDGTATLSNGKNPRVYYLVQERMGFAGISWKVQFCVAGYDRWRVYGAHCSTLR